MGNPSEIEIAVPKGKKKKKSTRRKRTEKEEKNAWKETFVRCHDGQSIRNWDCSTKIWNLTRVIFFYLNKINKKNLTTLLREGNKMTNRSFINEQKRKRTQKKKKQNKENREVMPSTKVEKGQGKRRKTYQNVHRFDVSKNDSVKV